MFERAKSTNTIFPAVAQNNEILVLFNQSVYNLANVISILSQTIAYSSLVLFLLSLGFGMAVVGVEMMAVVQIAFFGLISIENMNPTFAALSSLQMSSGYNVFPNPTPIGSVEVPNKLRANLLQHFLFNLNFTLAFFIVTLSVGAVFFVLSKVLKEQQTRSTM